MKTKKPQVGDRILSSGKAFEITKEIETTGENHGITSFKARSILKSGKPGKVERYFHYHKETKTII